MLYAETAPGQLLQTETDSVAQCYPTRSELKVKQNVLKYMYVNNYRQFASTMTLTLIVLSATTARADKPTLTVRRAS